MLDPERAIQAAILEVAGRDAPELARELIDAAQRNTIPLPFLLMWIHDRPRPLRFAPPDFLRWAGRYRLTQITPTPQTHPHIATDSPDCTADPPASPQLP